MTACELTATDDVVTNEVLAELFDLHVAEVQDVASAFIVCDGEWRREPAPSPLWRFWKGEE